MPIENIGTYAPPAESNRLRSVIADTPMLLAASRDLSRFLDGLFIGSQRRSLRSRPKPRSTRGRERQSAAKRQIMPARAISEQRSSQHPCPARLLQMGVHNASRFRAFLLQVYAVTAAVLEQKDRKNQWRISACEGPQKRVKPHNQCVKQMKYQARNQHRDPSSPW